MNPDRRFAHTLDEKISQASDMSSGGPTGTEARVATPALWDLPGQVHRLGAQMRKSWAYLGHASAARETPVPPRRKAPHHRRFTATQRQALHTLQRLGATGLDPSFSEHQLRLAFRSLAKRFHPDRHPMAGPADKQRLARTFASLCDAYRALSRDGREAGR